MMQTNTSCNKVWRHIMTCRDRPLIRDTLYITIVLIMRGYIRYEYENINIGTLRDFDDDRLSSRSLAQTLTTS